MPLKDQWRRGRGGHGWGRCHAERDDLAALIRNRDGVRREPAHECRLHGVAGRVRAIKLGKQEELRFHILRLLRVALAAFFESTSQVPEPHHTR